MNDEELITAVAEKVMGWHKGYGSNPGTPPIWLTDKNMITGFYVECKSVYITGWKKKIKRIMWNPITDISHAWMVVEGMRELGFTFRLGHGNTVQGILTWVKFSSENYKSYHHHNQPGRAICLAALEAVRGEDNANNSED